MGILDMLTAAPKAQPAPTLDAILAQQQGVTGVVPGMENMTGMDGPLPSYAQAQDAVRATGAAAPAAFAAALPYLAASGAAEHAVDTARGFPQLVDQSWQESPFGGGSGYSDDTLGRVADLAGTFGSMSAPMPRPADSLGTFGGGRSTRISEAGTARRASIAEMFPESEASHPSVQLFGRVLDTADMHAQPFMDQMFGPYADSFEVQATAGNTLKLYADLGPDGSMGRVERTLQPKQATHDYFKLEDGNSGGDIAKQMLAGQIPLYQKMGIGNVNVHANIDVGGYAWARYGFAPTKGSMADMEGSLTQRLQAVRDQIPPETFAHIQQQIASSDPKSLWQIADDKTPVMSNVNQYVDAPPGATLPIPQRGPTPQVMGPAVEMPLGKHMLLGQSWQGKLNLNDPESVARFSAYVNKPVPAQ